MQLKNIILSLACAGVALAKTSQEVVKEMGLGWNLGNTMEACGDWINGNDVTTYETSWSNPKTTKAMIDGIRKIGFRSVRIPVAWSNLMSSDYTISKSLLKRVDEIVNYVLDNNMYAIVNIHYDNGWFGKFATSESSNAFTKFQKIWSQVSAYFKSYDEHLIFESLNEEGCWNDLWNRYSNSGDKTKAYGTLNELNQNFVDIVRKSGGNNGSRHLLLAGYCTDIDLTVDSAFKLPSDSANKMMVSVHYYTPSTFTILEKDESWGKFASKWGTDAEVQALLKDFDKLKSRFVDKGIPVIIGEYGTVQTNKDIDSVHKYLMTCAQYALTLDMCPMLWDNGEHFDRKALTFRDKDLMNMYVDLAKTINGSSGNTGNNNGNTGNTGNGNGNTGNGSSASNTCWSEPDYPCCKGTCKVYYTDSNKWGVENNNWCGIPESCTSQSATSCPSLPDYPCCSTTCKSILVEDGIKWGVEDNHWCGIKPSCK